MAALFMPRIVRSWRILAPLTLWLYIIHVMLNHGNFLLAGHPIHLPSDTAI